MNDMNMILPHVRLKFNVDHPSYEDCYLFGYQCAQSDMGEDENPFAQNTAEAEQWVEGWWAGFYGEEPLFSLDKMEEEKLTENAANEHSFNADMGLVSKVLRITGAIAASAVVGYQLLDLVA